MGNIDMEAIRLSPVAPGYRSQIPVKRRLFLRKPKEISTPFAEALRLRRSAEEFLTVNVESLSPWLYYVAAVQAVQAGDSNRQRRFVASFGALHPTHILLGTPEQQWFAYLPEEHALGELRVDNDVSLAIRARAMEFYRAESATIVGLLCDLDLVDAYYSNSSELILRDAGVLLGHAALVASPLEISFRILGATGCGLLERLVCDLPFSSRSVGMGLVGRPNHSKGASM